eukprot:5793540-Pleurochrysis_carterae.AAC.1
MESHEEQLLLQARRAQEERAGAGASEQANAIGNLGTADEVLPLGRQVHFAPSASDVRSDALHGQQQPRQQQQQQWPPQ